MPTAQRVGTPRLLAVAVALGASLPAAPAAAQENHPQPAGASVEAGTLAAGVGGVDVAWRCLENLTMVVWAADRSVGDDGDGWSIQGRFFRGREPIGPQFQVNDSTAGDQVEPVVEVHDNGDLVVAWYSSDHSLRRRTYDRSTLAPGPEAVVALPDPATAVLGSLHLETDGHAAASWRDGDYLRGQRYETNGAPAGSELEALWRLNPSLGGGVRSVIRTNDESQLIGWRWHAVDMTNGDEYSRISIHRFGADGSPLGEVPVAYGYMVFVGEGKILHNPRLAFLPGGGFAVAYDLETWYETSFSPDLEVLLSTFDNEASVVFQRERITPTVIDDYFSLVQDLVTERDGDLLVIWRSVGEQLLGRRLASATPPGGDPFQVADEPVAAWPTPQAAAAFCRPSSPFVVAWSSGCGGTNECVRVRWFLSYPDVHADGFESGDLSGWCFSE